MAKICVVLWTFVAAGAAQTVVRRPECDLEPQTGSCRAFMVRFYFNPFTDECHEFIYGGCGGNGNRFLDVEQCIERCRGTRQEKSPDCRRPPDTGPCRGHLERFYYDPWSERCERFQYGGCRGNRNNFRSFRECMATCSER
uniref:U109-Liphistoxin-Lth1a_1 n=1 Tax=Liphistius thaleban TaxID=1905330 RepID=A0A4Q8K1H3_9ARAC